MPARFRVLGGNAITSRWDVARDRQRLTERRCERVEDDLDWRDDAVRVLVLTHVLASEALIPRTGISVELE